jgi:hypothetical protein
MNARFAPKGEKPEWLMIYEALLANAEPGTIVTYAELEALLNREFATNRGPLYRARQELGELRKHWLESVPNVGYRVIEPTEHVRISATHRRKSRRQVGMAIRVLESTDLSKLTGDALTEYDAQSKLTFALWAVFAHESRLRRIEDVLRKEGLL